MDIVKTDGIKRNIDKEQDGLEISHSAEHGYLSDHLEKQSEKYVTTVSERKIEREVNPLESINTMLSNKESFLHKDAVFFIKNDSEKQSVLDEYRKKIKPGSLVQIFSAENIFEDDLLTKNIHLKENEIEKIPGRLFSDEQIFLVFDFTKMSLQKISELNDLLEEKPSFEGNFLSKSVHRIIFVSKDMLSALYNSPSADFWSRVCNLISLDDYHESHMMNIIDKLSVNPTSGILSNRDLLCSKIHFMNNDENNDVWRFPIKKIDFGGIGCDWKVLLKGGFLFNKESKIEFKKSQLEELSAGDCIILHDAPWQNEQFIDILATIFRENGYYANGKFVKLPENIFFISTQTSLREIEELKKIWIYQQNFKTKALDLSSIVVLNSQSLDEILLNNIKIERNKLCTINPIMELLKDCTTLFITNDLTNKQWLCLLREINTHKKKINIIVTKDEIKLLNHNKNVQFYSYQNEEQALEFFSSSHEIYQVNSHDEWSHLWYKLHFENFQKHIFTEEQTSLLDAIINGKKIVLYGLEYNPLIASQLESLLINSSYIVAKGRKIKIPKINLTILCSKNGKEKIRQYSFFWEKIISSIEEIEIKNEKDEDLEEFFSIIKTIPFNQDYSICFPWETRDFKKILEKQVEMERKNDESKVVLPFHKRKALCTLLAKKYRVDENVFSYLKVHICRIYPDKAKDKINKIAMQKWLTNNPELTRELIRKNFWILLKYCPLHSFKIPNKYGEEFISSQLIDKILYYILGVVSEERRENLSAQLNVSKHRFAPTMAYYDSHRYKFFYKMLAYVGIEKRKNKQQEISTQAKELEYSICRILYSNMSEKTSVYQINKELQKKIDLDILEKDFKDLAVEIYHGKQYNHFQQSNHLKKLANCIELHPLIFLQGKTGVGKSHTAQKVFHEIKKKDQWKDMPPPLILSLGPETTKEFLYGCEKFEKTLDGNKRSYWQLGPIIQWAMNPNPPLLILDEANLVKDGVLAPLVGLTYSHAQICINGESYKVENPHRHRIILTGNVNSYSGRQIDRILQDTLITFYYRPLSKEALAQSIIEPSLSPQLSHEDKQYIIRTILFLLEQFSQFIPNDISPRDLYDILASIHHTLSYYQGKVMTKEQINALVWTAFEEVIVTSFFVELNHQFIALKYWYYEHYHMDYSILSGKEQAFHKFISELKDSFKDTLFIETEKNSQIIYYYWLFLEKQKSPHQKRKGLIIEGPSGLGKDTILKAVFVQWQKQNTLEKVHFLNANLCNWLDQVEKIKQAMEDGKKVVISEMNLIPSHHLEGLFNEVLTGSFNKGFALIATMNPVSFTGREKLSAALKNRFQYVQINFLTKKEIYDIIQYHFGINDTLSWYIDLYYFLSQLLQRANSSIQLTRSNLIKCAELLIDTKILKTKEQIFEGFYGFAFCSLSLKMDDLEGKFIEEKDSDETSFLKNTRELSLWLNKKSEKPIVVNLIKNDCIPHWCDLTLTLTIPYFNDQKKLQKISEFAINFKEESYLAKNVNPKNDFTKKQQRDVMKYFYGNSVPESHYRLKIYEFANNGKIKLILCSDGGVEEISPLYTSIDNFTFSEEYLIGEGDFYIKDKEWSPLPGVSPYDQLIYLKCENNIELLIGRGNTTGQIVVKLKHRLNDCDHVQMAHIRFIIKTVNYDFDFLDSHSHIEIDENLCNPFIWNYVDKKLFSEEAIIFPGYYALQAIKKTQNNFLKLKAILRWMNSFLQTKNISGDGLENIMNHMLFQQGCCLQQAKGYCLLCQYFGIPARCIDNDIHLFVEVSFDKKRTWKRVMIQGGADVSCDIDSSHLKNDINNTVREDDVIELVRICCDDELSFILQMKAWHRVKKIISRLMLADDAWDLSFFSNRMDFLLRKQYPVLNFLLSLFPSWHNKISLKSREYQEVFFDIFGKLIDNIHECFKKKHISMKEYSEFLLQSFIFINDENFFLVLNVLEEIIDIPDFLEKEKIKDFLYGYYNRLLMTKQLSEGDCQELLKFNTASEKKIHYYPIQGKSKTLVDELQKITIDNDWGNFDTGLPLNITRYLEGKRAFPKRVTVNRKRHVVLCQFFIYNDEKCKNNIRNCPIKTMLSHILREYRDDAKLQKREDQNSLASFILKTKYLQESLCENFLLYFLQETYTNLTLIFPVEVYKDDCVQKLKKNVLPIGCYRLFEACDSLEKAHDIFKQFSLYSRPMYTCFQYNNENIERIKDCFDDPSTLFITRDFLEKCFIEYLNSIDYRSLLKETINGQ